MSLGPMALTPDCPPNFLCSSRMTSCSLKFRLLGLGSTREIRYWPSSSSSLPSLFFLPLKSMSGSSEALSLSFQVAALKRRSRQLRHNKTQQGLHE